MCMCMWVLYVHVHSLSCVCAYAALAHMLVLMCMRTCTSYGLPRHVSNARMCQTFVSCMCVCVFVSVCMSVCMFVCGHVLMGVCVCAYMHLCRVHTCTHGCVLYAYYTCKTVYMWHMMTTSLDHVVQKEQAVEGLKAVRWQQQAQPSGACTLCSSS